MKVSDLDLGRHPRPTRRTRVGMAELTERSHEEDGHFQCPRCGDEGSGR
jgi:predicted RNA-binding Zn-ribbon protein involved in translation (DUF1610 family)